MFLENKFENKFERRKGQYLSIPLQILQYILLENKFEITLLNPSEREREREGPSLSLENKFEGDREREI